MDTIELMRERHSVRQYLNQPVSEDVLSVLQAEAAACNQESGLHIQIVTNEPKAFQSFMAHYGKFSGVTNYIAMIGKKSDRLDENCGYYGERLVLKAQSLGLNTCWVALTYKKIKSAYKIRDGEKLCIVIAFGYGKTAGTPHQSKSFGEVTKINENEAVPEWFHSGIEAALLAPTAVNQQKFQFSLSGDNGVSVKAGTGPFSKVDLGIVKYHFEQAAGVQNFHWV